MDLVLETGLIVPGANSYADVPYADDYFQSHPFYSGAWQDLDSSLKSNLLVAATSSLDGGWDWRGRIVSQLQPLRWPRGYVTDRDGRFFPTNVVPEAVRQAVCEQAFFLSRSDSNPDAPSDSGGLTELKIDVIDLKFGAQSTARPVAVAAARLLAGLGAPYFGGRVRVLRVSP